MTTPEEPFSINAEHLARQAEFSQKTFGPNWSIESCLSHITKEVEEIREAPDDLSEWADVILLAFGGALRRNFTPQQILDAIRDKHELNENRNWPDWRTQEPGQSIHHEKDTEPAPYVPTVRPEEDMLVKDPKKAILQLVHQHPGIQVNRLIKEVTGEKYVSPAAHLARGTYWGLVTDNRISVNSAGEINLTEDGINYLNS